jgi:hypothetical protein
MGDRKQGGHGGPPTSIFSICKVKSETQHLASREITLTHRPFNTPETNFQTFLPGKVFNSFPKPTRKKLGIWTIVG